MIEHENCLLLALLACFWRWGKDPSSFVKVLSGFGLHGASDSSTFFDASYFQ